MDNDTRITLNHDALRQFFSNDASPEARMKRLDDFATLMDAQFTFPGTNFKFGIDAIIGLIPGIGDAIGGLLSLYLLNEARAWKLPWHAKGRMLGNVALETIIGAIPLVGDLFDAGFKANKRNVGILKKYIARTSGL